MKSHSYRKKRQHSIVDGAATGMAADEESLIPLLQQICHTEASIDPQLLGSVSDRLKIPDMKTAGVASFYSMLRTGDESRKVLRLCDGPVCMGCGADKAFKHFENCDDHSSWIVERSSCLGLCDSAPAALAESTPVGPLDATVLNDGCDVSDAAAEDLLRPNYSQPRENEVRIKLRRIGKVDPESLDSAVEQGAYRPFEQSLQRSPSELIAEVERSELRGRGGAGFPTGKKMSMVAAAQGQTKYVVCNADESEPTAFKDRVLMESDPHLLLEGMAIAGYAVGATHGIIYVRGEYELSASRLELAIEQAEERKLFDRVNSKGQTFSFDLHVHRGAGAYICGEETALLESLEGKRGEPRLRPPYPTTHGFRGCPTLVNNVETLCALPSIIEEGADKYAAVGTENGKGTKLFTVSGHVNHPGVFEAPFGITLRQIIDEFGGGMREGSKFKMALAGGAAGTIVCQDHLDIPLDFDARKQGITLGSGGFLILDQTVSVVNLLLWIIHFFEMESCGKCTPCREGTTVIRKILQQLRHDQSSDSSANSKTESKIKDSDITRLKETALLAQLTSFCGLGQSIQLPVESAFANFGDELLR